MNSEVVEVQFLLQADILLVATSGTRRVVDRKSFQIRYLDTPCAILPQFFDIALKAEGANAHNDHRRQALFVITVHVLLVLDYCVIAVLILHESCLQ